MKKPTIVFIAAGKNSRFFPLNTDTHKGNLTLMGQSLIIRALDDVIAHGYTEIVIVVSEKDADGKGLSGVVQAHKLDASITFVTQTSPKGQGDAVLAAAKHVDGDFIVASPYYLQAGEIADKLYEAKKERKADCVLIGLKTDTPSLFGILKHEGDRVIEVVEKPKTGTEPSDIRINSIYLFDQGFLETLKNTPPEQYSLETAYSAYAKSAYITYILQEEEIVTLKYAWHLFDFQKKLFESLKSFQDPTAKIADTAVIDESAGPVHIAAGARIEDFAVVKGPTFIGEKCLVGQYCLVRSSNLEQGAIVGAYTEVVRSILFESVTIHQGYVADSILGSRTTVGAGLITANKRLDGISTRTMIKERMVETQRRKLGLITGSAANIGIRVNTMPAVLIGQKVVVPPNHTISKNIDHSA